MLKGSSANRMTKIKVYEGGKCVKTITNASINYGQDFDQLRKMIEIAIRLSPQDPIYNVEKVFVATEGKDTELDQTELEQFQNVLFRPENQIVGQKVSLSIHVGGKKGRTIGKTNDSENQENAGESNIIKEPVSTAASKGDQVIRAASPFTKRATTPNKLRSVSRTRSIIATPSAGATSLPRGMSPGRSVARQLSANARPISELMGGPVGSLAGNNNTSTKAAPVVVAPAAPAPPTATVAPIALVAEPVVFPETPQKEREAVAEEEEVDPLANHAAIIQELEQKSRESIEGTWMEVSGEGNSPVPAKSLAPFAYYSPPPPPSIPVKEKVTVAAAQPAAAEVEIAIVAPDVTELTVSETAVTEAAAVPIPMTPPRTASSDEYMSVMKSPSLDEMSVHSGANNNNRSKTPIRSAKKSMLTSSSAVKTPNKAGNNAATSNVVPGPTNTKPVYPDGRTLRESSLNFENSFRSYGAQTNASSAKKKPASLKIPTSGKFEGELSPVFQRSSKSNHHPDGRPSIGTMTTQWEFMRTNFVNNSDEELEWLMVSKKQGAYAYANKKNENAEDRYFRSLYEVDFYETKIKYFAGYNAKIPAIIGELAAMYNVLLATPKDEAAIQTIATQHAKLVDAMNLHEKDQIFAAFNPQIEQNVLAMLQETDRFKIVRKARDIHSNLTPEISALQGKLIKARKDGEEALKNMEKWSKRCMEADEYPAVMRAQEQAWMEKEYDDNMAAYRTMRSYYPNNVTDISPADIANQYIAQGGLISMELAQELKTNKFLLWLETHPDDIVYDSFLTGERKTYFENLESMDIVELRALATVIPAKFELDNDGKKAEWRTRFFNRLKQLVSQQRHEKVKGAWDATKNARTLVDLPPLKPDILRRPIYYFRTKEQSDLKLKQFDDKLALLAKKQKWLEAAEKEAKDAKEEYDTVLKEMRDPDFIDMYGAEQLASVKDMAKNEWANAEKKRKTLAQDVQRLQKSINDSPFTREQLLDKENELERFLLEKGILWAEKGVAPVLIEGVFDAADKTLEKRIKASAKFVSAEEEAAKRKEELESLKARSAMGSAADIPEDELALSDPMMQSSVNASAAVAVVEGADSSAIMPSTNVIEVSASSTSSVQANYQNALLANVSATPMTPTRTPRKHSILTHTNPELLNTLNKMFSSPAATNNAPNSALRARTPNRRASVAMGGSFASSSSITVNNTSDAKEDGPKEVKKSKSKLLKKLLGEEDEDKNSKNGLAATLPPGGFGGPGARPMSALAMALSGGANKLGNALGGAAGAGGGMSFLDQIKARRGGKSTEDGDKTDAVAEGQGKKEQPHENGDSSLPSVPPSQTAENETPVFRRPPNPFAAAANGGGMSFLEQIKARRKTEE